MLLERVGEEVGLLLPRFFDLTLGNDLLGFSHHRRFDFSYLGLCRPMVNFQVLMLRLSLSALSESSPRARSHVPRHNI